MIIPFISLSILDVYICPPLPRLSLSLLLSLLPPSPSSFPPFPLFSSVCFNVVDPFWNESSSAGPGLQLSSSLFAKHSSAVTVKNTLSVKVLTGLEVAQMGERSSMHFLNDATIMRSVTYKQSLGVLCTQKTCFLWQETTIWIKQSIIKIAS